MMRTQIYLSEDTHELLLKLAVRENTSLSELIREGAKTVIKKRYGENPLKKSLNFWSNPPKKRQIKPTGGEIINILRKDRDEG